MSVCPTGGSTSCHRTCIPDREGSTFVSAQPWRQPSGLQGWHIRSAKDPKRGRTALVHVSADKDQVLVEGLIPEGCCYRRLHVAVFHDLLRNEKGNLVDRLNQLILETSDPRSTSVPNL